MKLSAKQKRTFSRIQCKYNVSVEFLEKNVANIQRFLFYIMSSRAIIKRVACYKRRSKRVFIKHWHLRYPIWHEKSRQRIKARIKRLQKWSKSMMFYLRTVRGVQEYVEETFIERCSSSSNGTTLHPAEVSQKLKEQLELLRSGKRNCMPLIQCNNADDLPAAAANDPEQICLPAVENATADSAVLANESSSGETGTTVVPCSSNVTTANEQEVEASSTAVYAATDNSVQLGGTFLDMLMTKVGVAGMACAANGLDQEHTEHDGSKATSTNKASTYLDTLDKTGQFNDSSDEFLGFEEDNSERLPGMLMTPRVPSRNKSQLRAVNAAFISESLEKYMRDNALGEEALLPVKGNETADLKLVSRKFRGVKHDGLVTPGCKPPPMEMPAVPASLQRLRTVAERRQYLQRFGKNHKLAIINNEAMIYRELQRKIKPNNKSKYVSQQLLQAINSPMPFTRLGWQASSFITTEYNRYYYEKVEVYTDLSSEPMVIKLPGVRGNNEELYKKALYLYRLPNLKAYDYDDRCSEDCCDMLLAHIFKPVKTIKHKAKLNKAPMASVFRPCPLSQKPFQKPLDDETAALLLAGGSMAVVRMPTVELEVFPQLGKPLDEIAKRYLQYILPHCDITREWAEFSVSTLQQPHSLKQAEALAVEALKLQNGGRRRRSFTFAVPYLNDRNQILVRRVVDRSEKLDQSFEQASHDEDDINNKSLFDLNFRKKVNTTDEVELACADAISDMINCVAISCSENSFIKDDPDNIYYSDNKTITDDMSGMAGADHAKFPKCERKIADDKCEPSSLGKNIVQHKKQNRLLMELRRLNATIIDAGSKTEKESKPCGKPFCTLGCICSSLADDMPLRQHCGKSKCVVDCNCKNPNQSRIMRLEMDGRSITTEDAFMLRRKATERLARMEKEFTSTVVLTENETLLINESQYDKKRRCTKAPKRYEDFAETDEDFALTTPPKKAVLGAATTSGGYTTGAAPKSRCSILVDDNVLNELKHCRVILTPLPNTQNMVPWCMMHELYKCFCDGRASEGKPLIIETHDVNGTTEANVTNEPERGAEVIMTSKKAAYSFEQEMEAQSEEKEKPYDDSKTYELDQIDVKSSKTWIGANNKQMRNQSDDDEVDNTLLLPLKRPKLSRNAQNSKPLPYDAATPSTPSKAASSAKSLPTLTSVDVLSSYFMASPDTSRRCVPVPRKTYLLVNRRRSAKLRARLAVMEDTKTRLLLNEHILRSVYYHKHELERQRQQGREVEEINGKRNVQKDPGSVTASVNEVQPVNETTNSAERESFVKRKRSCDTSTSNSLLKRSKYTSQTTDDDGNQTTREIGTTGTSDIISDFVDLTKNLADPTQEDETMAPTTTSSTTSASATAPPNVGSVPRITSCFSMHDTTGSVDVSNSSPSSTVASSTSAAGVSTASAQIRLDDMKLACKQTNDSNFRKFYNTVITNMNGLVSKKMQDIDMALRRESKVIPMPNEEILCIIKWPNFLDAFIEGFVYIWEVKMREHSFFAATINKQLPMVVGALGVVNITTLNDTQLPLMGRMLMQRCRSKSTKKLAVVMQGRSTYWLIRGYLRSDSSHICVKPTPQSHPLLTTKINLLCSLLVKQRMKEYRRKAATSGAPSPSLSSSSSTSARQHHVEPPPPAASSNTTKSPIPAVASKNSATGCGNDGGMSSFTQLSLLGKLHAHGYDSMKTNIDFRKLTPDDIDEIHPPEHHTNDHRWLVLDLHNDFSHIFVPDFRDLVSLDRIQKVMAFSQQRNKIVKLQFFKNAPYDAFITPNSLRKIYFGPLKMTQRPPLLILLQSVDGQMMLREIYQRKHGIRWNPQMRTSAMWVLRIAGQIHFEFTDVFMNGEATCAVPEGNEVQMTEDNNQSVDDDIRAARSSDADTDDEEDCVIIETSEATAKLLAAVDVATTPAVANQPTMDATPLFQRINLNIEMREGERDASAKNLNIAENQAAVVPPPQPPLESVNSTSINAINRLSLVQQQTQGTGFVPVKPVIDVPESIPANPMDTSTKIPVTTTLSPLSTKVIVPLSTKVITATTAMLPLSTKVTTATTAMLPLSTKVTAATTAMLPLSTKITAMPPLPMSITSTNTSQQMTLKPILKRRFTLLGSLPSKTIANTSKIKDDSSSICNVSTIGTTTITKLPGEFKGNTCNVSSAATASVHGNISKPSFASITIAKIKPMKDTNIAANTTTLKLTNASSSSTGTTATLATTTAAALTPDGAIKPLISTSDSTTSLLASIKPIKESPNTQLNRRLLSKSITVTPISSPSITTRIMPPRDIGILAGKSTASDSTMLNPLKIQTFTPSNHSTTTVASSASQLTPSALTRGEMVDTSHQNVKVRPVIRIHSAPRGSDAQVAKVVLVQKTGNTSTPQPPPPVAEKDALIPKASVNNVMLKTLEKANTAKLVLTSKPTIKNSVKKVIAISNDNTSSAATSNATTTNTLTATSIVTSGSPTTPIASTSTATPITPVTVGTDTAISYGYFYSNLPGTPKFVVRREGEIYLVKVRNVGIIQIQTTARVNSYLNRHMAKIKPELIPSLPTVWNFASQNKFRSQASSKTSPNQKKIKLQLSPIAIKNDTQKILPKETVNSFMAPVTMRTILPSTGKITISESNNKINNSQKQINTEEITKRSILNSYGIRIANEDCTESKLSSVDTIVLE